MPILFSAVSCDKAVMCKFASCDGNFLEILEQVMLKIPYRNGKMTYSHGHYLFHYIVADKDFYFCITDKMCQRSRAFLFLNEVQRRFIQFRDKRSFTKVLAEEMYRYSEDYNTITVRKGELDELNNIGVGCSETILGEKILHVNNTNDLSYSTITYLGKSPENIVVTVRKPRLLVILIVILLVLGIVFYIMDISIVILTGVLIFFIYQIFISKTENFLESQGGKENNARRLF